MTATAPGGGDGAPTRSRRVVKALERAARDLDGNSSLLERFDAIAGVLFCAWMEGRGGAHAEAARHSTAMGDTHAPREMTGAPSEDGAPALVAARLRAAYAAAARERGFPARFAALRGSDAFLARAASLVAPLEHAGGAHDLVGLAYEELVHHTFDKGDNQQFFTPRPLVEFILGLLGGALAGRICDPACGTGGFLLGAAEQLRRDGRAAGASLLGLEIDERLAWVARLNLEMHGAPPHVVRCLDGAGALGVAAERLAGTVDVIVTNPPFGSDLAGAAALSRFELGAGRATRRRGVLFVERCLALLRPGGTLAIVIDDAVLNAPSNADARALLLREARLAAVVALPDTAFMPYATVKASVVLVRKRGDAGAGDAREDAAAADGGTTFFAVAGVVGRKMSGDPLLRPDPVTRRLVPHSDLPAILAAWRGAAAAPDAVDGPPIFRAPLPAAADGPAGRHAPRLDAAFHHPARHEAARALRDSPYPVRRLDDLCAARRESVVPARDLPDEELTYIGLASIEALTGACWPQTVAATTLRSLARRVEPGDVLFARLRPELRKVCMVPNDVSDGLASAECAVLAVRRDGDGLPVLLPELLALLLRSDLAYGQLVHQVIGIGRPRISPAVLRDVQLPVPPRDEQHRLLAEYRSAERTALALRRESERAAVASARALGDATTRLLAALLRGAGDARAPRD